MSGFHRIWDSAPGECFKWMEAEWDKDVRQSPDACHVDALLRISDDVSARDREEEDVYPPTGWDEAVCAWGEGSPLACLFRAQMKGRQVDTCRSGLHCLLCADMKLPEVGCHGSQKEAANTAPPTSGRPSSTSSSSSSGKESPVSDGRRTNTTTQTEAKDFSLTGRPQNINEYIACPSVSPCTADQRPTMKDDTRRNSTFNISSFAVLPPLGSSAPGSEVLLKPSTAEMVTVDTLLGDSSALASFRESSGKEEKRRTEVHPNRVLTGDGCISKMWTSQHNHNLLSAVNLPKRHLLPFSTPGDTLARVGGHLRQEDPARMLARTNSGRRLYSSSRPKSQRQAEPQLPMLFGTRVPIPVSTHRLL
ncbi:uncharacterized protein C16orf46 homolog [Denticeps clupeoides]|uniref:uncharacterized protein C16orf46 homolog n=1 Tax=Denticeps clupeoides TaxID=299321 RepID=UPI0010A3B7B0|nr:uncharacterized protein C16orf46 homolog [Denticeps clupeoides]XP_028813049.1 uncharacterized protein C16orf46 homolog [Denticeps clupeoides]XP_028813050.1 uncharacterized protein C16orf46 homolog [Denticeps clupeoides]XP_028813051.1 uncharacterized protein C16orf46 homolog [Denticeps clupeoides]